ncbi:hypothetical protein D9M71_764790 [compost metagenome]
MAGRRARNAKFFRVDVRGVKGRISGIARSKSLIRRVVQGRDERETCQKIRAVRHGVLQRANHMMREQSAA